jgi:D-alanyl-D-alanine dipeptidase
VPDVAARAGYARGMPRALVVLAAVAAVPAAAGPRERPAELVEIGTIIPDAVLDLRYATADNFTGKQVYPVARCRLRRAVATRLAQAAKALRTQHRHLLLWDCYRPSSIQEQFWKLVPDERYVANPKQGSRHSRGAAVDVALVDDEGKSVRLPTPFDDFSEAAHRDHALVGAAGIEARRLEAAMQAAGFIGLPTEWWHFDAPDAASFPLSDDPL